MHTLQIVDENLPADYNSDTEYDWKYNPGDCTVFVGVDMQGHFMGVPRAITALLEISICAYI